MEKMNFQSFLKKLAGLKKAGWRHRLQPVECDRNLDHLHLQLELNPPGTDVWMLPRCAVSFALTGDRNSHVSFNDPHVSWNGLHQAAMYIDWLRYGQPLYARARMKMMKSLGISEEEVHRLKHELQIE